MKKYQLVAKVLSVLLVMLLLAIVFLWVRQELYMRGSQGQPLRATAEQLGKFNFRLEGQILEDLGGPVPQQD